MKADISIIVPIYKGQKYIPYWLNVVEKNAIHLNALQVQCELILVNDFPEEKIAVKEQNDHGFILKVLNLCENRGIHGARVYGLEHAEGDWVVFLDQDDKITDDYLVKQKRCIGDADGVICNGYVKYFCKDICDFIYVDSDAQKITKDLSYYIAIGNPICSPGQVMLKRKAISVFWRQHILKVNGADDYFLWILMLKEGKEFALNEEKLYIHIGHGSNVSNDMLSMSKSIHEVDHILVTNNILDDMEKEIILNRKMPGLDRSKSTDIIMVYDYWMYLENRNQSIADFLREHGYFRIGIYGMGYIGNRLCDFLSVSDIVTVFVVDRRAKNFICSIPVFCLEDIQIKDYIPQVDAIIVTAESVFESVQKEINKRYDIPVLSFKSILLEMIEAIGDVHEQIRNCCII